MSQNGYLMPVGGKPAYHVSKLRAEVDRIRADIERQRRKIEEQGFQKLENKQLAGLFGVAHWSEMHKVELAAFKLARYESASQQLTDGGYQREFLGERYYHVEKLKELVAIGKANLAALEAEAEAKAKAAAEADAKATPSAEVDTSKDEPLEDEGETPDEEVVDATSTEGDTPAPTPADPITWATHGADPPVYGGPTEPVTAEPVAAQMKPDVVEPVVAKPEPEVLEAEIVDQPYTGISYEERALADRKLLELIDSSLESVARKAIAILNRFNGDTVRLERSAAVLDMLAELRAIVDVAYAAKPLVMELGEHMDNLKAEASRLSPIEALKREVVRVAPYLDHSAADILACYVKVPPGEMKVVFESGATEQPTG